MPRHASTPRPRTNLAEVATRLAGQRSLWEPLVAFDPVSRYYARLAAEPTFEAWLLTWVPGQGTDWHDHGGSAGAFVTLQGLLTEEHATVSPFAVPRIVPGARELTTGTLRAFGTKHIHRVTNHALEPAVSLHVYSPALVEMNAYDPNGDELRLVRSQLVGVDW
jgi:predicted metal-dependent enzyme (double-stranded beta helix superfamily)